MQSLSGVSASAPLNERDPTRPGPATIVSSRPLLDVRAPYLNRTAADRDPARGSWLLFMPTVGKEVCFLEGFPHAGLVFVLGGEFFRVEGNTELRFIQGRTLLWKVIEDTAVRAVVGAQPNAFRGLNGV